MFQRRTKESKDNDRFSFTFSQPLVDKAGYLKYTLFNIIIIIIIIFFTESYN